ncbi:hypothetical protein BCR35DRAFT_305441 [Leucosporidium creatinivorum]|uniref:RING-type domain-containing protein n=1 Tax=Leucosporidium creatinivorum TaxID=106004 RepID=A0A1Y2F1S4_9BASI|nr:hypothetical protein BCR35DRAFT_305441 [Leucosporidium creatinivorum]
MWEVFIATAVASVSETFVRALNDDLASHTSFNLLSFSFLLHINSTPIPSTSNLTSTLAPPIQLYSHLLLTLLELLTLHTSFAFTPPLPALRLPITAFYSAIGQVFVVRGLMRMWSGSFDDVGASIAWEGTVWLNRAPEMVFELLGVLTIALRWLAAVLRREEVSQDTILGHPSHLPRMHDDFAIAAIRYGTACLESTRLAGLANEVSPLRILAPAPLALLNLQLPPPAAEREPEAYVELGRGVGAGEVRWRGKVERQEREVGGLAREVKTVEAGQRDMPGEAEEREPVRGGEILRFLALVAQICFYVLWRVYRLLVTSLWRLARTAGYGGDDATMRESWATSVPGLDVEDPEDEDWEPSDGESDGESSDSDEEAESEDDFDPASLYRDLASPSKRQPSHSPHASPSNALVSLPADDTSLPDPTLLLAHHLTTSASPLTRRRYSALASQPPTQAFSSAVEDRRLEVRRAAESRGLSDGWEERRREELDEARQRFCVVCTVEERTIICWPCRCLALCEECRENLAQRTPAPQHLCPTCRTPVKGFSRIFIP